MSTKKKIKKGTTWATGVVDPPLKDGEIHLPDGTSFTLPEGMRVAPFRLSDQPDEKGKYNKYPYFRTWDGESNWRKYATSDPAQIQEWVD